MKRFAALMLSCAMAAPLYAQTAATVNGKPISQKSVDDFIALLIEQGAQDSPELREQVKQEIIGRTIMVQAAEAAGVANQPAVSQEIELAKQGIMIRALMSDYLKKNPVTDAQVAAEYEVLKKQEAGKQEYRVRHILLDNEDQAKTVLADLKAKKTNFADAAKQYSKDPGSASRGGDLGWAASSSYVAPFANAVDSQKKGELSAAPVQSDFGWHILVVEDSRPITFPELNDVKDQIAEMMRQTKLEEFQQSLLKGAKVE